jgi:hypothetical protein
MSPDKLPELFISPPAYYRPLQIIHGLDRMAVLEDSRPPEGDAVPVKTKNAPKGQGGRVLPGGSTLPKFPELDQFLEKLASLGNGGIVTNVGFSQYLVDPAQWEILRYGICKAAQLGLRVWLYDEKGYPSGAAGGYVTRANPEFAALGIACYHQTVKEMEEICFPLPVSCKRFVWAGAAQDLERASKNEIIDLTDQVDEWQTLRWRPPEGEWIVLYVAERIMYEGTHASRNVSEFKQYINLLDEGAVKAFLRVTHEAYARELRADLWKFIDAIFTDEPSFVTQYLPEIPERYVGKIPVLDGPVFDDRPPALPWVADFLPKFEQAKGYSLVPYLYALFFSESDEACQVRQDYYEQVTSLYCRAFFDQVRDWCQGKGILSSGHVLLEESILDHPPYEGSLLATLKRMDLPGIDMLNCSPEEMLHSASYMGESFMAIKQAASAAHLAGRERIHSESSDWVQGNDGKIASLEERIGQANLQYALGINVITSYFSWQELGEQNWKKYNEVIGRLGVMLTGGKHVCDVAVLYPIRSMWASFLPPLEPMTDWAGRPVRTEWAKKTSQEYPRLVGELLRRQVDLDIVDEESLAGAHIQDGRLLIGEESYRVIILPPLLALGLETARVLERFAASGGILLACGELPRLANSAENTKQIRELAIRLFTGSGPGKVLPVEIIPDEIYQRIGLDLRLEQPNPNILYQHRELAGQHIYFITNCSSEPVRLKPILRQHGRFQLFWPESGLIEPVSNELNFDLAGYGAVFLVF